MAYDEPPEPTAAELFMYKVEEIMDWQLEREMPPHITCERKFREDCITQTAHQIMGLLDKKTVTYFLPHPSSADHLQPENAHIPPPVCISGGLAELAASRFAYLRFQFTDPDNLPEVCYELQDRLRRGESPSEDGGTVHPSK